MADPRTRPSSRPASGQRTTWSWRARKPGAAGARSARLPEPPPEDLKTAEWRVLGLVEELRLRVDGWSAHSLAELSLIEQIAATLIQHGLESGARMLYFEPGASQMRVRMRIEGVLAEKVRLPQSLYAPLLDVLKEAAGLPSPEIPQLQAGLLHATLHDRRLPLRLTCLPGVQSEVAILHLPPLDARTSIGGLSRLGMLPDVLAALVPALDRSGGLLLVAGPAGSGVPRTLYTLLHRVNEVSRHSVSIESPVEYLLPGVTQLEVDSGLGLTFPEALQTCLREQPDTVMLSDLPDPETASLALQAARAGRKILAGFSSDRAAAVPADLVAMGVPPYQVAAGLAAILVQHRVRRLCDACKRPDPQTSYYRERLASLHQVWDHYFREEPAQVAGACSACGYTGYSGHVTLFEVLPVTAKIRAEILRGASPDELRDTAIGEGMITLGADGKRRVDFGEVSLEDVLSVLGS